MELLYLVLNIFSSIFILLEFQVNSLSLSFFLL